MNKHGLSIENVEMTNTVCPLENVDQVVDRENVYQVVDLENVVESDDNVHQP